MKLSIVIVNWNVKDLLKKCIESIYQNPPSCDFEVIVADNASSDGSIEMLKNFSRVTLIENKKNLGFSAGNNQGFKTSSGEYILILNPDTDVLPGSLDKLIDFLDQNPETGAVAPKILNLDKTLQKSCLSFPTFGAMAARQLFLEAIWPNNPYSKKYMMNDFKHDKLTEVDQPMGACILFRKKVIDEVGAFDEHSFMFFDEVDLCFRIKKAGYKIFFNPDSQIIHHGGTSIKKWGFHNLSRHWTRSRNYFFLKNYGIGSVILLTIVDIIRVFIIAGILFLLINLTLRSIFFFLR